MNLELSRRPRINTLYAILLIAFIFWQFTSFSLTDTLCKCCLFVVFIYCIIQGKCEERILNPYYLFAITPLSLLIYDSSIADAYYLELKLSTILLALINMIVFLFFFKKTSISSKNNDSYIFNTSQNLIKHGWILFLISCVGNIIPPLASVLQLCVFLAIPCIVKSKKWGHLILMLLLWFVLNMDHMTKSFLLQALIILSISYLRFTRKRENVNIKIIIFAFLSLLLMLEMFNLKAYLADGGSFIGYISGDKNNYNLVEDFLDARSYVDWNYSNILLMPYFYLTTPWTNLQYVIDTQATHTYGLWAIKPILGWLKLDDYFNSEYTLYSYSVFNTFTYITVFFKDFGYWGSCLGSAALGFFVKKIYSRYILFPSPFSAACYAMTAQATLEMFFSNHFFMQSYPFTILVIAYIYRFAVKLFTRAQYTN